MSALLPNEPDRANRCQPSSFRRLVGVAGGAGFTAAVAHLEVWALMRALCLTLLLCIVGCSRPGIDETPHARPSQDDRKLAEENWQQLERAYSIKNLESVRSLIGKPILFAADVDYRGTQVTGRRTGFFDGTKIPCRWEFTRMQRRAIHDCCSMGVEVYGTLQSVGASGIKVKPQVFGVMVCL